MNDVEITLTGLTDLQCTIADFLWEANSQEDLDAVTEAFGTEQVEVIKQLMIAEMFDEVEDVTQANEILQSFTL